MQHTKANIEQLFLNKHRFFDKSNGFDAEMDCEIYARTPDELLQFMNIFTFSWSASYGRALSVRRPDCGLRGKMERALGFFFSECYTISRTRRE